jgi:serine/threonine-protein kinase HipA
MTRHEALEVYVELDGTTILAGRAHFHRARGGLASTTFQYDPDYLSQPRAYPVDPAFDLYVGTQQSPGLPGAFSDSAPDRWGRNLISKQERALARRESRRARTLDDVDFLTGVGDVTRQGALRFRTDTAAPFLDPDHTVPRLVHLPELLHAADSAASDTDDYAAVKALLAAGTGSLGGARPKASVLGEDGLQLIAKFPHHGDDWDVMAWEATALDLAARAGVAVAKHRLSVIDGRHLLLLERFDRFRAPSGDLGRIGYMSTMTLLGLRDGDSADYADIVERLPEISSRASDDALQLFRRVAVSVGLNNTDDHLRNHGFLRAPSGWTLSPAFDVNPNPDPQVRQTSILGADDVDQASALIEFAAECRLPAVRAKTELAAVADSLTTWREVALGNGVRGSELARFERSFTTGIEILRRAAD